MFKKSYKQETPQETDETKCAAYGCRVRASVKPEGKKWCCFAHAFAETDEWPRITHDLSENEWLVSFVIDLKKMAKAHQDWRAFATQFWTGIDDHCIPASHENDVPYQNRMMFEILYRCGQHAKRPEPRKPAIPKMPNRSFGI